MAQELLNTSLYADANLQAYWRFEGDSVDETANNHDGTDTAITYGTAYGKFGQGASFNGSTSKIPFASTITLTGNLSLVAWVKTTSTDATNANTMTPAMPILNNGGSYSSFGIHGGKIRYNVYTTTWTNNDSTGSVNDGNWHLIVLTDTGSAQAFYIDGVASGTAARSRGGNAIFSQIGNYTVDANIDCYNGSLDDLAIFNKILTLAEIQNLYDRGIKKINGVYMGSQEIASTRFITDSTAYYKLEDVNDSVGTNNLTNVNTVTFTTGKLGNGANFVGTSSQALYVSNATAWKQTGNFSVLFWAKTSSDEQYLAQASAYDGQAAGWFLYQTGTKLRFYICNHAGTNPYVETTSAINDGLWHQYVCLWNGTQMIIYKDGQIACTPTASTTAPVYITTYCELGCRNNSGTRDIFYTGMLDDFDILNRALTSDEIYSLYKTGVKKLNGQVNLNPELESTSLRGDANLVQYTRFEGNSTATVGVNGTDTNMTYGTSYGKFNQGAYFQRASSSRVDLGTSATQQPTSALSFGFWLNITANPASYCGIAGNTLSGYARGYVFEMNTTNINFNIGDNSSWGTVTVSIPTTGWHHFVGTWDGTVRLYLDGIPVGTPVAKASINYTSSGFSLGRYYGDTTSALMFNGYMDDMFLLSRALSAQEISNLYNTNIKKYNSVSNV